MPRQFLNLAAPPPENGAPVATGRHLAAFLRIRPWAA